MRRDRIDDARIRTGIAPAPRRLRAKLEHSEALKRSDTIGAKSAFDFGKELIDQSARLGARSLGVALPTAIAKSSRVTLRLGILSPAARDLNGESGPEEDRRRSMRFRCYRRSVATWRPPAHQSLPDSPR